MKIWDIQEVKLWEGSAVVFGANSETPNLSIVKSQEDINKHLEEINERMEVFIKALTDNKLSEKYNNLFILELMQLKTQYNSLLNFEEPLKDTLQEEEPKAEEKAEAQEEKETKTNSKGEGFSAKLWSIDLTGYNEKLVETITDASDPSWSSLLSD